MSLLALVVIVKRRFEFFSMCSLLMNTAIGVTIGVAQSLQIAKLVDHSIESDYIYIAGNLVVLMLVSYASIPLYAKLHNIFALQYLRACLTVPLFFER